MLSGGIGRQRICYILRLRLLNPLLDPGEPAQERLEGVALMNLREAQMLENARA
jgi:hypothetical protein